MPSTLKHCMFKQVGRVTGSASQVNEIEGVPAVAKETTTQCIIREEPSLKSVDVDADVSSPTPSSSSASLSMSDKAINCSTSGSAESSCDMNSKNVADWSSAHVRSWLESIGMLPFQVKSALRTLKSGKTLLAMSDSELERTFGLNNPLHRRKLRLAIDDLKFPEKK